MRTLKRIFLFLALSCSSSLFSQAHYQINDTAYIFWQEGGRISFNDYKGASFPNNITVVGEFGVWTVLDLPEHPGTGLKKQAQFYIAPVFDKNMSHAASDDSLLIAFNNIYFDICEVCARGARKKMSVLADSLKTAETFSGTFKLVVKEMHENRLKMVRKLYRDYFREKKKDALPVWRNRINDELQKTTQWATQPGECYRFIAGKPLSPGYFEDLKSNPVVLRDKYEQILAPCVWHAGFNQISRLKLPENQK